MLPSKFGKMALANRQASQRLNVIKARSITTHKQPNVEPRKDKPGQYTNLMHKFKMTILDPLKNKKYAEIFMNPVKAEASTNSNYYEIINNPMDVNTIIQRINNNYYQSVTEAVADFELMLSNFFEYYRTNLVTRKKGITLQNFFKKQMQKICLTDVEEPSPKNPLLLSKPNISLGTNETQASCHDFLAKLLYLTGSADKHARDFFQRQWTVLKTKVEKSQFRNLEEFQEHVDGIFKNYHNTATRIYTTCFHKPEPFFSSQVNSAPMEQLLPVANIKQEFTGIFRVHNEVINIMSIDLEANWNDDVAKTVVDQLQTLIENLKRLMSDSNGNAEETIIQPRNQTVSLDQNSMNGLCQSSQTNREIYKSNIHSEHELLRNPLVMDLNRQKRKTCIDPIPETKIKKEIGKSSSSFISKRRRAPNLTESSFEDKLPHYKTVSSNASHSKRFKIQDSKKREHKEKCMDGKPGVISSYAPATSNVINNKNTKSTSDTSSSGNIVEQHSRIIPWKDTNVSDISDVDMSTYNKQTPPITPSQKSREHDKILTNSKRREIGSIQTKTSKASSAINPTSTSDASNKSSMDRNPRVIGSSQPSTSKVFSTKNPTSTSDASSSRNIVDTLKIVPWKDSNLSDINVVDMSTYNKPTRDGWSEETGSMETTTSKAPSTINPTSTSDASNKNNMDRNPRVIGSSQPITSTVFSTMHPPSTSDASTNSSMDRNLSIMDSSQPSTSKVFSTTNFKSTSDASSSRNIVVASKIVPWKDTSLSDISDVDMSKYNKSTRDGWSEEIGSIQTTTSKASSTMNPTSTSDASNKSSMNRNPRVIGSSQPLTSKVFSTMNPTSTSDASSSRNIVVASKIVPWKDTKSSDISDVDMSIYNKPTRDGWSEEIGSIQTTTSKASSTINPTSTSDASNKSSMDRNPRVIGSSQPTTSKVFSTMNPTSTSDASNNNSMERDLRVLGSYQATTSNVFNTTNPKFTGNAPINNSRILVNTTNLSDSRDEDMSTYKKPTPPNASKTHRSKVKCSKKRKHSEEFMDEKPSKIGSSQPTTPKGLSTINPTSTSDASNNNSMERDLRVLGSYQATTSNVFNTTNPKFTGNTPINNSRILVDTTNLYDSRDEDMSTYKKPTPHNASKTNKLKVKCSKKRKHSKQVMDEKPRVIGSSQPTTSKVLSTTNRKSTRNASNNNSRNQFETSVRVLWHDQVTNLSDSSSDEDMSIYKNPTPPNDSQSKKKVFSTIAPNITNEVVSQKTPENESSCSDDDSSSSSESSSNSGSSTSGSSGRSGSSNSGSSSDAEDQG